MFIVFEGIDGCGKTTLSKEFAVEYGYKWTKEPTFTSEEADKLNLASKDDISREVEFCIDRVKHQDYLRAMLDIDGDEHKVVVCDRYIWSGLVYSKEYNPSAFEFAKKLYNHEFFLKPDVYVYVETPINVCYDRKRTQSVDHLQRLETAYLETKKLVERYSMIMKIEGIGKIRDCVLEIGDILGLMKGEEE